MSLSDQLRKAVLNSGLTRYRVAVDAQVDHAVLRRFLSGERDIKLQTADRLAEYLGFELKKERKFKAK
jgi:hypothetical protein